MPDKRLPYDAAFLDHPHRDTPFRAVFLNYLLDCLPAAVLEFPSFAAEERGEAEVKQLCVRTCLARSIRVGDHTDMTLEAGARPSSTTALW